MKNNLLSTILSLMPFFEPKIHVDISSYYKNKMGKIIDYYYEKKEPAILYESNEPRIDRVSKYLLGDGLLGIAFPKLNRGMVLETLSGLDLEKVLEHERFHIDHPEASEYRTRVETGTLYWSPNPYVSMT